MTVSMRESIIKDNLQALYDSCYEGYEGVWDPTGEGKDGFIEMASLIREVAILLKIDLEERVSENEFSS